MRRELVTSRSNPLAARLRRLNKDRAFRRAEGVFCGEGPKLLAEALKWNARLETVVCAQGMSLPELPQGVRVVEMPEQLLAALADTKSPQGILFTCRGRELALPQRLPEGCWLVLDGVQDPGNVGTIWRTADAFGGAGLILCNGCADPWSPKVVRSTMGAIFRLPVYEGTVAEAAAAVKRGGVPLCAAALGENTRDLREAPLRDCALVIGSEGRGVSEEMLALCDGTVKIPMVERCESLNAAAAAAVALWEMTGKYL